ncbi:MAG: 16S rRNA (uracil(1498)-N(3))-methyltransferase [Clostridia bacterium]|nr:16S rRNA (uracil(1498)-N(3))-methyltransferase [Clostridia bacterium]
MPRFFVQQQQITDGCVTILGDDAHHISRSLRMAAGERITVCDMQSFEYECELTEFLPDRVLATVISRERSRTEPPYRAAVFQALPKGDKLDSIIQKAVECGASEITTFESERCVVRAKDGAEEKKLERRRRIAAEAAKQSGRGILPTVCPTLRFAEAVAKAAEADLPLFCYEGEQTRLLPEVLKQYTPNAEEGKPFTVAVVIGSEGGFSLNEVEQATRAGLIPVGLGKRILRTETAASFVLSCLSYEFELS